MTTLDKVHPPVADLLEREPALAELRRALADTRTGEGRLALVAGEAGIGKTAVIRRFCAEQPASMRVLSGACDALFTPRPLGPLVDVAESTGGDLESVVAREAHPHCTRRSGSRTRAGCSSLGTRE